MRLFVRFERFAALRDRCEVGGVRIARGEPEYEDGAVVPTGDWSALAEGHELWLRPRDMTPDSRMVELVRPPAPDLPTPEQLLQLPPGRTADDFVGGAAKAQFLGCSLTPAKTLTTTENPATSRRLGLHLDNWDRLPYRRRHLSRRRLCLNLGPGNRYLLLADADALAICRAVHADYDQRCPHTDDVRTFAAGHPVQCYRVRLEPGEGYLAPTELVPHDGSTEDQAEASLAAFWLGTWAVGSLPSVI